MANKKLITLTVIVFIVGLVVGLVSLRNDFQTKKYVDAQADLVHAYFKVYNVSADAGIGYSKLISYIMVFNITNPTDYTLRLSAVTMHMDIIINYRGTFTDSGDNYLMPHQSRLVAFSQTGPVNDFELQGLYHHNLVNSVMGLSFKIDKTSNGLGGATVMLPELHVSNITQDEFVYGSTFGLGSYFTFDDSSINTGWSSGRFG
jgi:hypothetical protein